MRVLSTLPPVEGVVPIGPLGAKGQRSLGERSESSASDSLQSPDGGRRRQD